MGWHLDLGVASRTMRWLLQPQLTRSWGATLLSFMAIITLAFLVACDSHPSRPAMDPGHPQPGALLSQIQARGKLVAGVKYDSKPFGYLDKDGTLKGYDVDLIREITKRLLGSPDSVEFQQVLSSTRIMAIHSGSIDIVAATMTITPEREELIDFTEPYYEAGQAVLVSQNSPIQKVDHLKRILFVIGSTSESNMKKRLPKVELVGFKSATDAVSALRSGRGEAFTSDDTILSGFMLGNCDFRLLNERLSSEPYGLGIRQDPTGKTTESFRVKVNQILQAMKKDGTLERLKAKWIQRPGHSCPP